MTDISPGFLINPSWIVPVIPTGIVLTDHCIVVQGERIIALLPGKEARQQYPAWPCHDLPGHILTPGLINTHGHAAMTLLRGYADDLDLMDWLNNYIWPVEGEFVDYDFVYDGSSLAVAEMISTGTTCAADTYFFPTAVASAFTDNKFRGQVCMPVIQFSNAWANGEQEHIHKGLAFHDDHKNNHLINTAFAPHAPYTVTDKGFEQIGVYADELQIPIHLHLHETEDEVNTAVGETGRRPIQRMSELGLLSPALQAVHMTQMTNEEIDLIFKTGVHVIHCPDSNLKLASGFCPVTKLMAKGVNLGVGTDGAASNNNLDMLTEIRSGALLAKGVSGSALSVTAEQALAMGTINGARLLGLDQDIGSIEVGNLADLIAVDLSAHNFQPVHNPMSQLIYSATGHQVSQVWINGEHLLKDNILTQIDLTGLMSNVRQWQEKLHS
ncbi:MAG TPA: TRZ/ATZ family hydrolase [Gammaproteobacteria bacterium]|nr:TRZ/ATZ family hydrolase [Gammaproteobacteria bacterium]